MEAVAAVQPGSQWAEQAYEAIAPVYDDFTAHHNYEVWLGELLPKLRRHGLSGQSPARRRLRNREELPAHARARGWEVTACDISPSMLELARAKAGDAARLTVADMRELPVFGEFDLVWALDDAVNYLLSAEELGDALSGMRANLAPGGLLMFDVNTLHCLPHLLRRRQRASSEAGGGWSGEARAPPMRRRDRSARRASKSSCLTERRATSRPTSTGSGTSPKRRCWRSWRRPACDCLDVFGHGFDAVLKQPVDELVHAKVVYIAARA